MKVKPRNTTIRKPAKRITAPETKVDPQSGKTVLLLSYIDAQFNQKHDRTTRALFLLAAGTNEEGDTPDGLDRLSNTFFNVHHDREGRAIGLDIIPSRMYRSKVIPVSQDGVKTLKIAYECDGAVARVVQRPFNFHFRQSAKAIAALDKLMADNDGSILPSMPLPGIGRIVSANDNVVEIMPKAGRRRPESDAATPIEDVVADAEE